MKEFQYNLAQHNELFQRLGHLSEKIEPAIDLCVESLSAGGTLFFCGNGGSAADSQHLAAEFVGRFVKDREPISAISLTTDTSGLTCIANDYDFKNVFARQLRAIGRKGDVLIAISTSGNSENIIEAVKVAREKEIGVIGLLGRDGGMLVKKVNHAIVIPSDSTARIQEAHILVGHTICGAIEKRLGLVE